MSLLPCSSSQHYLLVNPNDCRNGDDNYGIHNNDVWHYLQTWIYSFLKGKLTFEIVQAQGFNSFREIGRHTMGDGKDMGLLLVLGGTMIQ